MTCEPIYATRRRPERKTLGDRVANIAQRLGTPLMPWQQQIADVGGELIVVEGILVPAYREVIVTVPRQNGKTTLILSWELERLLMRGEPQRAAYTAQTGLDARKKLLEDQVPLIQRSRLADAIGHVRRVNGSEGIDFKNGSQLDVLASSESAGHGRTLHLGVIDEAFKDVDDRREGAMLPAMITVATAQLVVVSTMGTDASIYLNRKVDAGRDLAKLDRDDAEIAYFEYAAPLDAPFDDPRTWKDCNPSYGITINERALRHACETMTEGEFRRAHLNQRTAADDRVIPYDVWMAIQGDYRPSGTIVLAIDANPERTHSAVAAADLNGHCEVVEHEQGTAWLVATASQLAKKWNVAVAYDPAGPAGVFGDDLKKAGVRTIPVTGQNMGHACSFFFDGCVDKSLGIRSHGGLDAAVAAAKRRTSADAWVWARRDADADLSPLVACTMASWAVVHARKPTYVF